MVASVVKLFVALDYFTISPGTDSEVILGTSDAGSVTKTRSAVDRHCFKVVFTQ